MHRHQKGPVRRIPIRLLLTAIGLGTLGLGGCATLSESQCIASDWETVGYRDGANGTPSSQLLKHQNACVKHGVVPEREAYLAGWEKGVRQFCQPENAFAAGESGHAYANVCPSELQGSFHAAYQEGRQLYLAQSEIDGQNAQIAQKQRRLDEIARKIRDAEARLVADETGAAERRRLLDETKALSQEQGALEAEIQNLTVDVALRTERLKALRQTLAWGA